MLTLRHIMEKIVEWNALKKRIIIDGFYGQNSIGDEAILKGFLNTLKHEKFDITIISHTPKNTLRIHNTHTIGRKIRDWFYTIPRLISKSLLLEISTAAIIYDLYIVPSVKDFVLREGDRSRLEFIRPRIIQSK